VYTIFAILPLIAKGIGPDLWWRPLWALMAFASTGTSIVENKREPLSASDSHPSTVKHGRHPLSLAILIIISVFLFANIIYARVHLIPSEVYVHETSVMNEFYAIVSNKGLVFDNIHIFRIFIIDTPSSPSYEILHIMTYVNIPSNKFFILYLDCNISTYYISYFNGVRKSRDFSMLTNGLGICINSINDVYTYTSGQAVIMGNELPSNPLNVSLVFVTRSFFIGLAP